MTGLAYQKSSNRDIFARWLPLLPFLFVLMLLLGKGLSHYGLKDWGADYEPFGATRNLITTGTYTGPVVQNLRLPGQYADTESGLSQNGFRDYQPTWGRYLESDPIGLNGGMNTYAYASGNPLKYSDKSGLCIGPLMIYCTAEAIEGTVALSEMVAGIWGYPGTPGGVTPPSPASAETASASVAEAAAAEAGAANAASGAGKFCSPTGSAKDISWNPVTGAGPLGEKIASTFRSSTYTERMTTETTPFYRAYGGTASEIGGFWTRTAPLGPIQSAIDSALSPAWGNTATNVARINVPANTTIFEGSAASQGGLAGGGNQVFIQNVNPAWVVK